MLQIALLNGPNLSLLGHREQTIYGNITFAELISNLRKAALALDMTLSDFQSNHEGQLIDYIHNSDAHYFIINPGALCHTSIALRDAFLAKATPMIEIHISNIYARESFRHRSYLQDIAQGVIVGFGTHGYHLALQAAHQQLTQR